MCLIQAVSKMTLVGIASPCVNHVLGDGAVSQPPSSVLPLITSPPSLGADSRTIGGKRTAFRCVLLCWAH